MHRGGVEDIRAWRRGSGPVLGFAAVASGGAGPAGAKAEGQAGRRAALAHLPMPGGPPQIHVRQCISGSRACAYERSARSERRLHTGHGRPQSRQLRLVQRLAGAARLPEPLHLLRFPAAVRRGHLAVHQSFAAGQLLGRLPDRRWPGHPQLPDALAGRGLRRSGIPPPAAHHQPQLHGRCQYGCGLGGGGVSRVLRSAGQSSGS
mmetsp:Transcript_3987/g.5536  ORF Transcript_3987/g.5536 Transcript_3987/m.5536 type:complete len:205 (+) Transcript_3987:665-1279(+)